MVTEQSQQRIIAVVQARGGSKGIPRKNLRPLGGHPLVAHTIASGRAARRVTRVILSTDDPEIAAVGRRYGAEVPFLRPAALATDDATDFPLFVHVIDWLARHEQFTPDAIVQLRPTSPFLPPGLIDDAVLRLLSDPVADSVRSVAVPRHTPYKMWRPAGAYLEPLLECGIREPYNAPRQALPTVYLQTGHVDVFWTRTVTEQGSLTGRRVLPIEVDARYCVDIDTPNDWKDAEWVFRESNLELDNRELLGRSVG